MSFLNGIMKAVINPATLAQLAMGPAGWASIAMKAVISAVAQQVIQKLGQELGLPQGVIDLAQSAFSQASGLPSTGGGITQAVEDLGQAFGASPLEIGQATRQANDVADQLVSSVLKRARDGNGDGDGNVTGSQSRLMKLAMVMGKLLDQKMDKMIDVGEKMDKASKQGALSAQIQALGQELSMISNALNSTIKSIGESNTTLARKS